jgi:acyl-CoA synthetase (NDP forming)
MNIKLNVSQLDKFFKPASVAVIGASNAPFNLGATICTCLKEYIKFPGPAYAINRKGEAVSGCPGYTSVQDLPGSVDLAVIITPARVVPQFVKECGEKGIHNIIIESAGFSEQGGDGKDLQHEIDEYARRYGIRLLGPNCLGVLDNRSRFCCFYGAYQEIMDVFNKPGGVSYVIQSGGVGVVIIESLMDDIQGINKMVSIGNKSDVDEADLIEYFSLDNTQVIAMYLENVVRGEKLMNIAKRTAKPILVFKSGRTAEGSAAALSHTAGMANNDVVFESMCRQAGIVRLKSISELHSMPKMLTEMPLLRGNRIAAFTNSGAFGSISADLMVEAGLTMPRLAPETRERLQKIGGVFNVNNPVDIGPAPPQVYLDIFEILLSAGEVDGLLLMSSIWRDFVIDVMKELIKMCKRYDKPAAIYTPNSVARILLVRKQHNLPLFDSMEEAVRALVVSHEQFRYFQKKENPYGSGHKESN